MTYVQRMVGDLKLLVAREWTSGELETLAESQIEDINDLVKRSIDEQWKRVLGLNPIQNDKALQEYLRAQVKQNVALIQTIPERHYPTLETGLLNAYQQGSTISDIESYIDDRFATMETNANTVARTETGKIYSEVTEYRQRELGVEKYQWLTAGDERVRDSHAALDGQIFSWDDPPTVEGRKLNPGEDFNCRCIALPVFE